ncbi:MAG: HDOD domain-containing protein [Mariprofundaceae bacterium]
MHESIFSRNETLALIGKAHDLPTLPDRFLKIREIIADLDSDANDLAAVIATDIATAAALLKIANSVSYNPIGSSIGSLPRAIARLGAATSAQVAMSMALLQSIVIPTGLQQIRKFWTHAYAVSQIANCMASELQEPLEIDTSNLFMAALLHDIGRVILAIRVDSNYFDRPFFDLDADELCAAERAVYGLDHAEVGALTLGYWAMPEPIIRIAEEHHKDIADRAAIICKLADQFVDTYYADLQSIEAVQEAIHQISKHDIRAALESSSALLPHLKASTT